MKILFINQFFWPDSSATSQQLTDMAIGLAARGHTVTVLCGEGGYAAAAANDSPAGIHILRVKAMPFARGKVGRILSYLSFYTNAFFRGLSAPRQDVVVSLTTPPLISLLGSLIKSIRGSRHFIWEQDIYPDVAIDLGVFCAGGFAERIVGALADLSRRRANGILSLGACMTQRLLARGIPAEHIFLVENWANSISIQPMQRPGDPSQLVLLYSGNLGLAHDVDTMTGAMMLLREDRRFRFLFVGSASKRTDFVEFIESNQIRSVEFRPYVARDRLSEGLAAGDIGLVTQHNVCCGSVVPSKVYGILAAGRPVLFIGPRAATPALIIRQFQCGWQIDPGDVTGLRHLLQYLAANQQEVRSAGARAREVLVEHYDLPISIERVASILEASPDSLHGKASSVPLAPSVAQLR